MYSMERDRREGCSVSKEKWDDDSEGGVGPLYLGGFRDGHVRSRVWVLFFGGGVWLQSRYIVLYIDCIGDTNRGKQALWCLLASHLSLLALLSIY